jgi:hypothetical protein
MLPLDVADPICCMFDLTLIVHTMFLCGGASRRQIVPENGLTGPQSGCLEL